MTRRGGFVLATLALGALIALLVSGLGKDPRELKSVLVGKPWPVLERPLLGAGADAAPRNLSAWAGRPLLVNLWASWCEACADEHPALMSLAGTLRAQGRAGQLIGLNYKDRADAASAWLAQRGNPYAATLVDADGRLAIELGVYGAPESFVVDAGGRIAWKHVGPLTPELIQREVLPRLGVVE